MDPSAWKPVTNWDEFDHEPHIKELGDQIMRLNQIEYLSLTKYMQKQLGIPDSVMEGSPVIVSQSASQQAAAPQAGAGEEKKDEAPAAPTAANGKLVLTALEDGAKFKVLKEIRATICPGMKIMDAKKLVENLPQVLVEDITSDAAQAHIKVLKELGAVVELK
eukprot:CAMPEP_0174250258 /NCGR_PEP_ID=MMETSP0439-20130205/488_1 /TAXON_ID=0 /ORGANISM="Stereomyxa ramosa, Strain Chinc5" /LENGTH=162 /DNA_ID=CAMNT_0015330277 /DNA_START=150 /DNA_END=638 /DNA_ORIENTATION=+